MYETDPEKIHRQKQAYGCPAGRAPRPLPAPPPPRSHACRAVRGTPTPLLVHWSMVGPPPPVCARAERCLSNYLMFENSLNDPKMKAAVQLSEQLKNVDLEKMVEAVEEDGDEYEEGAEGTGDGAEQQDDEAEGEDESEDEDEAEDEAEHGKEAAGAGAPGAGAAPAKPHVL
jgi:hypothetical protein